ncbi:MAG: VWA domain-containing protein [Candidatus Xenobia bacterium]
MIRLGVDLSQTVVDLADETRLWVLIRMGAPQADGSPRAPLNLALVMDRSGSMAGDKLTFCQQAARFLVMHLAADDVFSLVTFDHEVHSPISPTHVRQKEPLVRSILGLRPGGSTNLSGGWLQGAAFAEQNRIEGGVNRVVVLTDGLANAGVTEPNAIVKMTAGLSARGVTTTAIGCGSDFNEDLLRAMADAGQGNFHFIATPEDAPTIFHRELAELLTMYAQNLRLRISPSSRVQQANVMHDFTTQQDGSDIIVTLGDIFAGDEKVVLLEMGLRQGQANASEPVASIQLTYQQVQGEVALREMSTEVRVRRGTPDEVVNPAVHKEVLLCQAALELRQAVADADQGHLDEARLRLDNTTRRLEGSPYARDPALEDQIQKLRLLQTQYRDQESFNTMGRKTTTYISHSTLRAKGRTGRTQTPEIRALARARSVLFVIGDRLASSLGALPMGADFGNHSAASLLLPTTFARSPELVWQWIEARQKSLLNLQPAAGHRLLELLAHRWQHTAFISIATDTLLHEAGLSDVLYVYGRVWEARCSREGTIADLRPRLARLSPYRPTCQCGASLRPSMPFSGEPLDAAVSARLSAVVPGVEALVLVGCDHVADVYSLHPDLIKIPLRIPVGEGVDDPHRALSEFQAWLAAY